MSKKIIIIDNLKKKQLFRVADNEKKTFIIILLGGKNQMGEVKIKVMGENADIEILGVIVGSGTQKINLYTLLDHQKSESKSDLFIKSVLLATKGKTAILKGAILGCNFKIILLPSSL